MKAGVMKDGCVICSYEYERAGLLPYKNVGDVYVSRKVKEVLVVTLENIPRYWGKAIRSSP